MLPQKIWPQSQVSHISIGTSIRPTGNCTTSSQTSYLTNYIQSPDSSSIDEAYNRTSVILSLQQKNCQFHAVAEITINRVAMQSANISTRFFLRDPQGKRASSAASALLSHLDEKQKDRWSEAVNNMDFTHSSRRHRI